MHDLLGFVIGIVVYWRIAIALGGSILVAMGLSQAAPFFGAMGILVTAMAGLAFGVYWHARSELGIGVTEKTPCDAQPLSWWVAALGFVFIALVLGGLWLGVALSGV